MMKVLVRITGQLSTAIKPVVGSMSSVIVPCSFSDDSPSDKSGDFVLLSFFGVGFAFGDSDGCGSGKPAGSVCFSSSGGDNGSCAISSVVSALSDPGDVPLMKSSV